MKANLQQKLTPQQINALPLFKWQGPTILITTKNQSERAVTRIRQETLVGFDTETQPAFRKGQLNPPSTMQLATSREVYIFILKKTGITKPLLELLSDDNILKTGVALADDFRELQKIEPFTPKGFVDLAKMSRNLKMNHHGLRGMAAVVLGVRISKSQRTSNWARKNLTCSQIVYAATDAWISREIYRKLYQQVKSMT